jgi:hypothetical protein
MPQTARNGFICHSEEIPIAGEFDVIVCGGGVAGVAAAACAARNGAHTLLIERSNVLGGTATGALMSLSVIPFNSAHGFPRELYQRISERGGLIKAEVTPWDPEGYKLAAAELVQASGVTLLLNTWVSAPLIEDGWLRGVFVENKSGRQAYLAKIVIDSSGDCDVAARAGVPYSVGRESDKGMRPLTVMGRLANVDLVRLSHYVKNNPDDFGKDDSRKVVDVERGIVRIDGFYSIVEKGKRDGIIEAKAPVNYLRFSGIVQGDPMHTDLICNSTRIYGVDGTDARALTDAEIEGRRQLTGIVSTIKRYLPGFEKSYLIETSNQIGVRETRRVQGLYTLTDRDILDGATFEDSIAAMPSRDYGTVEVHGPDPGEGGKGDRWAREMSLNTIFFEFPYRCLVPQGLQNVLVAGRCVSVSHDADRFVRNQVPAALTGQAAGVAAAWCVKSGASCRQAPISEIQRSLRESGVYIHRQDVPENAYN